MPKKAEPKQIWQCPKCSGEYRSPLRVTQVLCPCTKNQIRSSATPMKLVWDKADGKERP